MSTPPIAPVSRALLTFARQASRAAIEAHVWGATADELHELPDGPDFLAQAMAALWLVTPQMQAATRRHLDLYREAHETLTGRPVAFHPPHLRQTLQPA